VKSITAPRDTLHRFGFPDGSTRDIPVFDHARPELWSDYFVHPYNSYPRDKHLLAGVAKVIFGGRIKLPGVTHGGVTIKGAHFTYMDEILLDSTSPLNAYAFTHEVGHLLGLPHLPDDTNPMWQSVDLITAPSPTINDHQDCWVRQGLQHEEVDFVTMRDFAEQRCDAQ
jgi:hypothetical protein